ncbi:MAG: hypothetical protein UV73_C0003G0174 [Candidatus Gottesmanbacteria bacterium GW2011_GWA2_43_14]|uniref:Fimbrial assembly family protein, type IV pilus assembly protein PilN n=1 Tax=Candidatus Gottesmanbacteria bacterium GW2011_GWA2_43_14 TaxID=1618443 RepID=A0A0G1DKZ0_9BACT|nr:MAG: hypothetical protein UV73_C0003G0174 [Candidatus Gottesmanbacteria bacterium GW2011_GWA2_43_14]
MGQSKKSKTEINLLVQKAKEESLSSQFLNWALTYGRYIIIIIQIVVLSVFFGRFKLDRDRTDLKESVGQKEALVGSIAEVNNEIIRVQKSLADIKSITGNYDAILQTINFLENKTPADTNFNLLSFSKSKVRFTAVSDSLTSFNVLLKNIQEDEIFSDVQLEDLKRLPDGKVEFRVQANLARKV